MVFLKRVHDQKEWVLEVGWSHLPKGVSLTGSVFGSYGEQANDQSDKAKERLWMGQQLNGTTDDSYFFYKVD